MKKLLVLVTLLWLTVSAYPADFPNRSVTIILSLPAGSGPDTLTRKLAEKLRIIWKVPVVVENKSGGNGMVALNAYANKNNDNHSFLVSDYGALIAYPILTNNIDAITTFLTPLAPLSGAEFMLTASPETTDFNDLKLKFKANPVFGSWAVGGIGHLNGLELNSYLKISGTHIPYKDYGQWFLDVSTGLLPYSFTSVASSNQLEAGGKLKYIAYCSDRRHPNYPDVPTFLELTGQRIGTHRGWIAAYTKKSTPDYIKKILANDIYKTMNSPAMLEELALMKNIGLNATPSEFKKIVSTDISNYTNFVKKHNITIK
jgi:tripartite-type tricarboxylate transporter receptor subunit TctC